MGGLATQFERIVERNSEAQYYMRSITSWKEEKTHIRAVLRKQIQLASSVSRSSGPNMAQRLENGKYLRRLMDTFQVRKNLLHSISGMRLGPVSESAKAIRYEITKIDDDLRENWNNMRMIELNLPIEQISPQQQLEVKKATILQVLDRVFDALNRAGYLMPEEINPVTEDIDALITWYGDDSVLLGVPDASGLPDYTISNFLLEAFHKKITTCTYCGSSTNTICKFCLSCGGKINTLTEE